MNFRKAIFMLLLLVPLIFLVVQGERRRAMQAELDAPIILGEITLEDVESLKIFHADGSYRVARAFTLPSITTSGDPNRWVFSSPEGAPANQEVVDSVVKALIGVRAENSIAVEKVDVDQSIYGLNPPELIGILRGKFGERVVSFGKQNPVSKRRYVQPEKDGQLYLVDNGTFLEAAKAPTAVRAKYPLRFPREKVKSILALPRDGMAVHIFREQGEEDESNPEEQNSGELSSWLIKEGESRLPADTDLVHREIDEMLEVETIRYIDQAAHGLAYFGLLKPILTVRIELDGSVAQTESSTVVGEDDGVIIVQIGRGLDAENGLSLSKRAYFLKITGQPWVYEFARPFYIDWLQGYRHFQDRTPFDALDESSIERIELRQADRTWVAENTAKLDAAPQWRASDTVGRLLSSLYPIRVLSFAKAGDLEDNSELAERYGITKDSFSLELKLRDGGRVISLYLGKKVSASGSQTLEDAAAPRYVLLTNTEPVEKEADPITRADLVVVSGAEINELITQGEKLLLKVAK